MRLDFLPILGAAIGFVAILGATALEGVSISSLANVPAALVVIGGTLGASILQTPRQTFKDALTRLGWVFAPPRQDLAVEIKRISNWATLVRRGGFLELENQIGRQQEPFVRKGLQLLVDGGDSAAVRRSLELDSEQRLLADRAAAQVFRGMGGYAPTLGILGAVLGLIQVMGQLDQPDQLGAGIATAFVATIYGVGLANLLFLPLADRIRAVAEERWQHRSLLVDGLIAIVDGEHPRNIVLRLQGYLVAPA